ncbi:hypothetical protein M408DRAFT_261961, partial [Serendipita vermifera MAFF 305830]
VRRSQGTILRLTTRIATTFDNLPVTVNIKLRPSHALEVISKEVIKLQEAMKKYKPLMESSIEQEPNVVIKYNIVLAKLSPMVKAGFSMVEATFDVLKEQCKGDQLLFELSMRVGRVLPFAHYVLEDALCETTELLEPATNKLCELIVETATFVCKYIKDSCNKRPLESPELLRDMETINNLQAQFKILEENLERVISGAAFEATGNIEKDLILKWLKPIDAANYEGDRGCMKGTRIQVINDIVTWATRSFSEKSNPKYSNADGILWLYGKPGIGKTALTHSICWRLHERRRLGGSFFCRRDDQARSNSKSVLPTLIYRLSGMFGLYRTCVAQTLQEDPELTPQSASGELFLNSLQSLKKHPSHALVLVIDALDESGDPATRRQLLGCLLEACRRNKWLKVILTSRPEHDIQSFFDIAGVVGRDLAEDQQSRQDIQLFTYQCMKMVNQNPEMWAGERRLSQIVNRSGGLFIFVETLGQYLMQYRDPKVPLDRLLAGPSEEASTELHKLYLAAIETQIGAEEAEFRLMARTIIGVARHRALCDEAIAVFTGLELSKVNSWVDGLSSLLYRDGSQKGGIRVRHISILEYLVGPSCPLDFRVDLKQANEEIGSYCFQTMTTELRFNICGLETSYRKNSEIENLNERVEENVSDTLQYSCLYWSSHLCADSNASSREICQSLDRFFKDNWVLYWLEVLSLMGEIPAAISGLRNIIACSRNFEDWSQDLAEDVLHFVLTFSTPISTSAPHIYVSALPFMPPESSLWKNTCKAFSNLMIVGEGRMPKWPTSNGVLKGHTHDALGVSYSPDGRNIASCSFDQTIRVWDAVTGALIGEPLKGHAGPVTSVAYAPNSQAIISGSYDGTIRIWNAETGATACEPLIGHSELVFSVAYSPDGMNIVSGSSDHTIRIWDAVTGIQVGEPLEGHTNTVYSVAYSPDGKNVVSGSADHMIRIWDAETGAPVGEPLKGHTNTVNSVAYSPDSKTIVSGSSDHTIRTWNAATRIPIGEPRIGHDSIVSSVLYSPDGRTIISGSSDSTIRVWDAISGTLVGDPLRGHAAVRCLAYHPNSRTIVSSHVDSTVRLWDVAARAPVGEPPKEHSDMVSSVLYSPDGRNIVSGSYDRTIRIWDAVTGAQVGESLKGHSAQIVSVACSPDGRSLISASTADTLRVWNAATRVLMDILFEERAHGITSIAYSPDGCNAVSGSEYDIVQIWETATGTPVGGPLKGDGAGITSVAYSPDGRNIVSGSYSGILRIWDSATGASFGEPLVGHRGGVTSVAYSPDSRNIISGSYDKTIRIWDVATGGLVREPLKGHTKAVCSVAYSPNGRNIVSGSQDRTVMLWDAVTGTAVCEPLKGHTKDVMSVAYSPDGQHIVSGSADHTIRVWDVEKLSNTDKNASSKPLGLPIGILSNFSLGSSGLNSISRIALNPESLDSDGW